MSDVGMGAVDGSADINQLKIPRAAVLDHK